jgi:hypothetical protein
MANPFERFGSRVDGVRRLGREDEVEIVNRAARNSAETARTDGNRNGGLDQEIELLRDPIAALVSGSGISESAWLLSVR